MNKKFNTGNEKKLVLNKKAIAFLALDNIQMKGIVGGIAGNGGTFPSEPGSTTSKGEPCTTDPVTAIFWD